MEDFSVYWQKIIEAIDIGSQRAVAGNAIPISLMGMTIVFFSLLFISIFIASLPHILKLLNLLPDEEKVSQEGKSGASDDHVIAAIGAVLRHRMRGGK
jgi:hypothetical protein